MEGESDGNRGENADVIDDEETGGEWVTEENLHKHLSHGFVLPIVPTETELGASPALVQAAQAQTIDEETKEEDEDFPAFDEAKLPSLAELEAKKAQIDKEVRTEQVIKTKPPETVVAAPTSVKRHPIEMREGSPLHVIFLTSDMAM